MSQIRNILNSATTQICIHTRQHADDVLARTSRVTVRNQPIVKAIGDRPNRGKYRNFLWDFGKSELSIGTSKKWFCRQWRQPRCYCLNVKLKVQQNAVSGPFPAQLHITDNFTLVDKCSAQHFSTRWAMSSKVARRW